MGCIFREEEILRSLCRTGHDLIGSEVTGYEIARDCRWREDEGSYESSAICWRTRCHSREYREAVHDSFMRTVLIHLMHSILHLQKALEQFFSLLMILSSHLVRDTRIKPLIDAYNPIQWLTEVMNSDKDAQWDQDTLSIVPSMITEYSPLTFFSGQILNTRHIHLRRGPALSW